MIHKNTMESFKAGIAGSFKTRAQKLFEILYFKSQQLTDKEILERFAPGSDNKNLVSPRLTEMVQNGILEETGDRVENGNTVRVLAVKQPATTPEAQGSLF